MADFIFEGEVESLSIRQQEFICEVLEQYGYKNNKVTIEAVGKAGDNYIANVKRICVVNDYGDIFKMIAKIAPTNEIARERTGIAVMFINECAMYQEILPTLVDLQKSVGVPEEDLFRHAKCYGVLKEPPHELILLEDLTEFVILDRFKPLSNETVKLILKRFAVLHSLSLVLKEKDPRIFGAYRKKLIDFLGAISQNSKDFQKFLANLEKDALEVLDDETYKAAVRNSVSKMSEEVINLAKDVAKMKHSVVIQGDGWINNIMFRLKDNAPVDCVMIDYQLSKISNPVCDILFMIFSCTDHDTRHTYYNQWIDYYYLELDNSLSYFGMKASEVYSRDELNLDMKNYSKLFFDHSIWAFSILIRKSEDAAKVKEAIESGDKYEDVKKSFHMNHLDVESMSLFKSKIEGLVDSYREFGYIN